MVWLIILLYLLSGMLVCFVDLRLLYAFFMWWVCNCGCFLFGFYLLLFSLVLLCSFSDCLIVDFI